MPKNSKSSRKNCRVWKVTAESKDGYKKYTMTVQALTRAEAVYLAKCRIDGSRDYKFRVVN